MVQCFSGQNLVGLLSPAGYEDSIISRGEKTSLGPPIKGYCPFPHSDLWQQMTTPLPAKGNKKLAGG